MTKVGSVTSRKDDDIKRLFLKARPGDFVQIRRSHTGSHSAIVYSVTNNGVTFMEANLDNKNTIYKKRLPHQNMIAAASPFRQVTPD